MEITPFIAQVSEIAAQTYEEKGHITVIEVTDKMDAEGDYDKKEYRLLYQRVYNVFRFLQQYGWILWYRFTKTRKYASTYKELNHYEDKEEVWTDEHFKELYDMGIFSRKQMEESIVESKIFERFVDDLKETGILFLIAGRGVRYYRIPNFYDYCIYKYENMRATGRILRKQVEHFAEDGMLLPVGVRADQLEDLSNRVLKALEYKKED